MQSSEPAARQTMSMAGVLNNGMKAATNVIMDHVIGFAVAREW